MIYTVAVVGILATFLASLPKKQFRFGLEYAWILICVFLAIRYDFGNDYKSYYDMFLRSSKESDFIVDKYTHIELGWQLLCWLFKDIGFFGMVGFLTAFECYVYYMLIKKYVKPQYYWFSIFIFVFSPNLMLIGASMMRNQLAITLFILSIKFIREHKLIPYLLIIFIASQFHKSALVLYPLYLLGYIKNIRFSKLVAIVLIVLYIVLMSLSDRLVGLVGKFAFYANMDDKLEWYSSTLRTSMSYSIGYILQFFLFGYLLFSITQFEKRIQLLCILLIARYFIEPFSVAISMVGRLSYYFGIFAIFVYPSLLDLQFAKITHYSRILKYTAIFTIFLITLYSYISFFSNEVWMQDFSSYKTIFSLI